MSLDDIRGCVEEITRGIRTRTTGDSWHHVLAQAQRSCALGEADGLITALRAWPASREFVNTRRHFGRSAHALDIDELAEWIVLRASVTDTQTACHELEVFAQSDGYPAIFTLLVSGPRVAKPLDIGAGVRLIPYEPEFFADLGFFDAETVAHDKTREDVRPISSAFVLERLHPKVFTSTDVIAPKAIEFDRSVYEHLDSARLICALVGPREIMRGGYRAQVATSVPCYLRASYASYGLRDGAISRSELADDFATSARALFEKFVELPVGVRRRFFIPLERIQNAIHEQHTPVESAIDLGIALESLFLDDSDATEVVYRLSLRAARLLASDTEERRSTRRLFKSLYTLRSRAVHRGKVDLKADALAGRRNADELLADGIKATAQAARRLVELGGIDWSDFDLA